MPTITVKLDKKRAARLARWARRGKVPKSDVIRALLDGAPIATADDLIAWSHASPPTGRAAAQQPRQQRFVPLEAVLSAFAFAPRIATGAFREDLDAVIDQDPTPRA